MEPEIAVQGSSTNNDRVDCNWRYQCKMLESDFIDRENNGREFLWGGYIFVYAVRWQHCGYRYCLIP